MQRYKTHGVIYCQFFFIAACSNAFFTLPSCWNSRNASEYSQAVYKQFIKKCLGITAGCIQAVYQGMPRNNRRLYTSSLSRNASE
jgi:hypothetical protein